MSTRRGLALTLIALPGDGCASTHVTESDRLRAQAAYERGSPTSGDRQPSPALAALKEAVGIDPGVAVYRDTLGLVYLELARPDLAIPELQKAVEIDPEVGRRPLPPRDRLRRNGTVGGRGGVAIARPWPCRP